MLRNRLMFASAESKGVLAAGTNSWRDGYTITVQKVCNPICELLIHVPVHFSLKDPACDFTDVVIITLFSFFAR